MKTFKIRIKNENCTMAGQVCHCDDDEPCGDCSEYVGTRSYLLELAGDIRRNARNSKHVQTYKKRIARTIVDCLK